MEIKIKEKEKNMAVDQMQWEPQNHGPSTSSFMLPQPLPRLNIGYLLNHYSSDLLGFQYALSTN